MKKIATFFLRNEKEVVFHARFVNISVASSPERLLQRTDTLVVGSPKAKRAFFALCLPSYHSLPTFPYSLFSFTPPSMFPLSTYARAFPQLNAARNFPPIPTGKRKRGEGEREKKRQKE